MEFEVPGKPVIVTRDDPENAIYNGWIDDDPLHPGQLLLCVTNSYTFVRIPIGAPPEGFEHAKGTIPHDALAFAADHPGLKIKVAERHVMVGPDASFRRTQMTFPDLAKMLPPNPTSPLRFAFNTELLANLAEAMGTEQVELIFDLDKVTQGEGAGLYNSAVLVRRVSQDQKGQEVVPDGIIMPVRVEAGGAPPPAAPEEPSPVPPPEAAAPAPAEPPVPPAQPPAQPAPPPEHPPPPA